MGVAPVTVLGAISDQRGLIYFEIKNQAFNAEEVRAFIVELKEQTPWDFLVLMDNASIHVGRGNPEYFQEQGIKTARNLPYRPDLMGIERFWLQCKQLYRKEKVALVAAGLTWNQHQMVARIMEGVPVDEVKGFARWGLNNLKQARPVDPKKHEHDYGPEPKEPISRSFKEACWGKGFDDPPDHADEDPFAD